VHETDAAFQDESGQLNGGVMFFDESTGCANKEQLHFIKVQGGDAIHAVETGILVP
jgi:hypothetical protein